jgi:hypothetical protein
MAPSVSGRIATGPRRGRRVTTLGDRVEVENIELEEDGNARCATVSGVSLYAEVCVPARDRMRLERLSRYVGRPPLALERLSLLPDGRLLYRLKRCWRNATSHVVYDPLTLLEKLAALVPPPRFNLVRYHGILASAARSRSQILPARAPCGNPALHRHPSCASARNEGQAPPKPSDGPLSLAPSSRIEPESEHEALLRPSSAPAAKWAPATQTDHEASSLPPPAATESPQRGGKPKTKSRPPVRPRNYAWAELLKPLFLVDPLICDRCGARMRIVSVINPPEAIRKILDCLGLPSRAPPVAEAAPEDRDRFEPF